MSNQVLIILHQATSTPGRIGTLLKSRGYNLIVRRPALGDKLPDTLQGDYAAAIMFGGPMSANDKDDFIRYEKDWIQLPLKEDIHFLVFVLERNYWLAVLGGL